MYRSILLVFVLLATTSCATILHEVNIAPVRAIWQGQQEGARGAFLRCMYEVSESQCGTSDVKNPATQECMRLQVAEYREQEMKTEWLIGKGCHQERASLRAGEI